MYSPTETHTSGPAVSPQGGGGCRRAHALARARAVVILLLLARNVIEAELVRSRAASDRSVVLDDAARTGVVDCSPFGDDPSAHSHSCRRGVRVTDR